MWIAKDTYCRYKLLPSVVFSTIGMSWLQIITIEKIVVNIHKTTGFLARLEIPQWIAGIDDTVLKTKRKKGFIILEKNSHKITYSLLRLKFELLTHFYAFNK